MDSITSPQYELTNILDAPETAPIPRIRSERAKTVAQWFGVTDEVRRARLRRPRSSRHRLIALRALVPRSNKITFLNGPSGAGKSSMLRLLQSLRTRARWIDLNAIALPTAPLVDCFAGAPLDQTLALLGQVGLGEVWTYLRTPQELSEGQRWRLRVALGIYRAKCVEKPEESASSGLPSEAASAGAQVRLILVADEFAALLDRVTASIVARCLRRVVSATPRLCAIVATSHQDLVRALLPDTLVCCDFKQVEVYRPASAARRSVRGRRSRRGHRLRATVPRACAARRCTSGSTEPPQRRP